MRKLELIAALRAIPGDPFIVFPAIAPPDDEPIGYDSPLLHDVGYLELATTENRFDNTAYESIILHPIIDTPCNDCKGSGLALGYQDEPCPICAGTGTLPL